MTPATSHLEPRPDQPNIDTWHIVSVLRQFEPMAQRQLQKRVPDSQAFYPYALRDDGRKVPVLPGLLFVFFPFVPDIHRISEYSSWIFGLKRRPDGLHMTVQTWEVEDLRDRSLRNEFRDQDNCRALMINRCIGQGAFIKIPYGPFVGHSAQAEAMIGEQIKLKIECLGKPVSFMMPASDVFPEFYDEIRL